MRLSPPAATILAGVALATALGLVACSKHTESTAGSDAGDAAGDDTGAAIDGSLGGGDDAATADELTFDDVATGNCAIPDGTYMVTATLSGDAGSPSCMGFTSTVTFPLPTGSADGGLACSTTADGTLPVCTVDFSCTQDGAGTTISTSGYIQVVDSSYAGYETVQEVSTMIGMPTLSTCSYSLEYAKQ
jgi:hypothetical protein